MSAASSCQWLWHTLSIEHHVELHKQSHEAPTLEKVLERARAHPNGPFGRLRQTRSLLFSAVAGAGLRGQRRWCRRVGQKAGERVEMGKSGEAKSGQAKIGQMEGSEGRKSLKAIQQVLQPMIGEKRLDRARQVLQKRTQAVRLVFCRQQPADVLAALRSLDQFAVQFAEIVGEVGIKFGDTSGGSRNFVTLRHWPDAKSCLESLRKAGRPLQERALRHLPNRVRPHVPLHRAGQWQRFAGSSWRGA